MKNCGLRIADCGLGIRKCAGPCVLCGQASVFQLRTSYSALRASSSIRTPQSAIRNSLLLWLIFGSPLVSAAQDLLRIERLRVGDTYEISTKSTLEGSKDLPIKGQARVLFRDRIVRAAANGAVDRVLRVYDEVDYQRKIGDQEQEAKLRPTIRNFVIDIRENDIQPYSLDGPLMWSELELLRTHPLLPILEGFLPSNPVKPGDTWPVPQLAVIELLAVKPIRSGGLTCRYAENIEFGGKKLAQFAFAGTVVGKTSEGEAKSEVSGAVYIDLATRRVHSLRAIGDRILLNQKDEPVGKVSVDYQITIRPAAGDPALADTVVAKLPEKPSDADLALLYEHPVFGVRLKHPRRWALATVDRGQLIFDTRGSSLSIHPEKPNAVPKTTEYARQVAEFVAKRESSEDPKEKIVVLSKSEPKEEVQPNGRAGNFRYRVRIDGVERFLDYWVFERNSRGVTASARLIPDDSERLALEVAEMIGSIEFFEPVVPPPGAASPPQEKPKPIGSGS